MFAAPRPASYSPDVAAPTTSHPARPERRRPVRCTTPLRGRGHAAYRQSLVREPLHGGLTVDYGCSGARLRSAARKSRISTVTDKSQEKQTYLRRYRGLRNKQDRAVSTSARGRGALRCDASLPRERKRAATRRAAAKQGGLRCRCVHCENPTQRGVRRPTEGEERHTLGAR